MVIKLDQRAARATLEQAVQLAQDLKKEVPRTWADWTREIADAPSRTFTAALGTALLAKASDGRIDPLALKAVKDDKRAYSARTLCHGVLVPASIEYGFDLGATGREPLNNQPFFRYDRIDDMARVHAGARGSHERLVECLTDIDKLSPKETLGALAAFIRVRLEIASESSAVDLRGASVGVAQLIAVLTGFMNEDTEGGRRGQAVAAAVFDMIFDQARTGRINDPSRRFPGDVQGMQGTKVVAAAEVRQKPVSYSEALQFAASVQAAKVGVGLVLALHPEQQPLDRDKLLIDAERKYGIFLGIVESVPELVASMMAWSGRPADEVIENFPERVLVRLSEIEVRPETLKRWKKLLG